MDKKTIFIKTGKGESEVSSMSGDMKRVLLLIDGVSSLNNVIKRAPPSLRGDIPEIMQRLLDAELINDKAKMNAGLKIVSPRVAASATNQAREELDFTRVFNAPRAAELAAEAARERARADVEAAASKQKEEAAAAQMKARLAAEAAVEARRQAEAAVRARAEAEAIAKREAAERHAAEVKVKTEAEARLRAEQEAMRVKAALETAAKVQREAEEKARHEAEAARIKAAQEAARVKMELEAIAKAKAEVEAARAKAEEEAARAKAELEAAKARAEAEARAMAEERSRIEEERQRQEAEAARIRAQEEAAARARAEEERQRQEAEAARIKAEEEAAARARAEEERQRQEAEAARAKAEEEAAARAKAEEERRRQEAEAARIRAQEEAAARAKTEEERQRQEAEAARIKAEEEAAARARAEEERRRQEAVAASSKSSAFKIDLDALKEVASAPVMVQQAAPAIPAEPMQQTSVETKKEQIKQPDIAAEMARLKAEQEAEKQRLEQEALEQEEAQRLAAEQAAAWAEAEQRAAQQSKLETEQTALQAALAQAKAQQQASGRRQRRSLPIGKILGGLFALALVLVFVLPLFWPMDEYISPIEQRLSERLGESVKVGGLKASLLPLPKLEIRQITVGSNQALSVASATLRFDPLTLFSPDKVIDETVLQGVVIDGQQLEKVMGWLNGLNGNASFSLRQLNLQGVQIKTTSIALPQLKGSALFEGGEFARLVLHDETDKMHVDLKSVSGRLQIAFGIRENSLPLLPQVKFSDFNARGEIMQGGMVLSELDAHAYNGIWSGSGKLSWGKEWSAEARIDARTMDMDKMLPQYGLAGEVFVNGVFSSRGASLSGLADALRLEATFEAKRGVINGIDMVETARLLSREHLVGGRTHFDQMNGSLLLENHVVRLRQIKISSGMLNASGSFDIANDGRLAGSFSSEIKMRAGNNPLVLSGTLKVPKLQAR